MQSLPRLAFCSCGLRGRFSRCLAVHPREQGNKGLTKADESVPQPEALKVLVALYELRHPTVRRGLTDALRPCQPLDEFLVIHARLTHLPGSLQLGLDPREGAVERGGPERAARRPLEEFGACVRLE